MSNRTQYENDLAALKTALAEMGQSAADAVDAAGRHLVRRRA